MKTTYILLLLIISPPLFANETVCSEDYVAHQNNVIRMISSKDELEVSLGHSQRDCLSVKLRELKPGDNYCPAFRQFEQDFLEQEKSAQIQLGKACYQILIGEHLL